MAHCVSKCSRKLSKMFLNIWFLLFNCCQSVDLYFPLQSGDYAPVLKEKRNGKNLWTHNLIIFPN